MADPLNLSRGDPATRPTDASTAISFVSRPADHRAAPVVRSFRTGRKMPRGHWLRPSYNLKAVVEVTGPRSTGGRDQGAFGLQSIARRLDVFTTIPGASSFGGRRTPRSAPGQRHYTALPAGGFVVAEGGRDCERPAHRRRPGPR